MLGQMDEITFDKLVAPVTDLAQRDALASWRWLVGDDAEPLLLTAMGDMFVRHPHTGEVCFVDTLEGSVRTVALSYEAWKAELTNDDNLHRWFLPALVAALRDKGIRLADGQCYSPIHPPCLGGEVVPDNFEATHWRVHFGVAGQLHFQTKNLPPGTKIEKIIVKWDDTVKKPWWKFWQ